jgi:DNA-binding transcriptional regulator YdaS (Cro superfamily)
MSMPSDNDGADPNQRYVDWIVNGLRTVGKSQQGLARVMGVSPTVVTRIVKGTRPIRAQELAAISSYLAEGGSVANPISQPRMVEGKQIRYRVEPRDVPAHKAARRLHLTQGQFEVYLSQLFERGFPRPDPTTGLYDLKRIDEWMDNRGRPAEPNSDYYRRVKRRAETKWEP